MYWPDGGWDGTRQRDTATFVTGTGNVRASKLLNAARTYVLSYKGLGRDNFNWLESFNQGHMGRGPFVFLDPSIRNYLTANQSSATSLTNDTRDFTVSGTGGTIATDSTTPWTCPRSLRWTFATVTPGTSVLSLARASADWPGIPVTLRSYTFWFVAIGAGTDGVVQLTPTITWLSTAGATVGTSTGTATSTVAGLPVEMSVTATPPTGATFMLASIAATSATIAAGDIVILNSFQVNEGTAPDSLWSPGTGILPVQVMSQKDITPFMAPEFKRNNTLVLQEVRV
jgi:hypothetical protein